MHSQGFTIRAGSVPWDDYVTADYNPDGAPNKQFENHSGHNMIMIQEMCRVRKKVAKGFRIRLNKKNLFFVLLT